MKSSKLKVVCILGTRPEAIKMAPVILELCSRTAFEVITINTGQHDMAKPILDSFGVNVDFNLELMKASQSLEELSSLILLKLPPLLEEIAPNLVLVQGDTVSAFISSLSAFYKGIRVGHIEAGLRSYSKIEPFPEEMSRCLITRIVDMHFAPTILNQKALIDEGVPTNSVVLTGNTVIDALYLKLKEDFRGFEDESLGEFFKSPSRKILLTAHRRESFGEGIVNICNAVNELTSFFKDIEFLVPAHYNPLAREPINNILGSNSRVKIIEPLSYIDMIHAMNMSHLILTDSGGLQEEGPALKKPVLVLRNVTERSEGIDAGTLKLVGTDVSRIVRESSLLLSDPEIYQRMAESVNPYGDGLASKRIVDHIEKFI